MASDVLVASELGGRGVPLRLGEGVKISLDDCEYCNFIILLNVYCLRM